MNRLLHILSAMLVAVTAQAYAAARTAEGPVGQMVICAGNTVMVFLTDADGAPMEVPHICPEASFLAAAPTASGVPVAPQTLRLFVHPESDRSSARAASIPATARAPPGLV